MASMFYKSFLYVHNSLKFFKSKLLTHIFWPSQICERAETLHLPKPELPWSATALPGNSEAKGILHHRPWAQPTQYIPGCQHGQRGPVSTSNSTRTIIHAHKWPQRPSILREHKLQNTKGIQFQSQSELSSAICGASFMPVSACWSRTICLSPGET